MKIYFAKRIFFDKICQKSITWRLKKNYNNAMEKKET